MATGFTSRNCAFPPANLPDARRLTRRITHHIALALMVYASLQLWLVLSAVAKGAPTILPHVSVALVLLAVIPTVRRIEKRWVRLAGNALPSIELRQRYRRELARLWIAALALPFLWVGAFVGASAAAGIV